MVCAEEDEATLRSAITEPVHTIGRLVSGSRAVQLI